MGQQAEHIRCIQEYCILSLMLCGPLITTGSNPQAQSLAELLRTARYGPQTKEK